MKRLSALLTMCLLVLPAQAKYSGGSGTAQDPYQIATAADLIALGETPADYDKHFLLTADIDLDPKLSGRKVFDRAVIAPDTDPGDSDWYGPVFTGTPFTGVFDGNGHTISRLTIKGGSYLGLFGYLASGGEVRGLGEVDVKIIIVTWSARHGGLVGYSRGTVTRCYSTGTVSGNFSVGGLVGVNEGTMTQCYSTGEVSGRALIGGLVGQNGSHVTDCYSAGAVWGNGQDIGGLVGQNMGHVTRCYSTNAVGGSGVRDGLIGGNGGDVTASFWDTQTAGQAETPWSAGTGKTTAEMQTASTFLNVGWDFVGETANGSDDIWKISAGLDYPRLSWEKYSGGTGEPNDPYQIATVADLITLGDTPADYGKHFLLTADIDLDPNLPGRKVFDRGVIAADTNDAAYGLQGTSFSGVLDGNGHKLSHLTITGAGYLGLFGQLSGEVRNLAVVGAGITGSSDHVGALVGYNGGHATQCRNTGIVSGSSRVGGLVGYNTGAVTYCGSSGAVNGGDPDIGGLVGLNWPSGDVTACYSTAVVKGQTRVGGLVGCNVGQVTDCYSTGAVSGLAAGGGLVGSQRYASGIRVMIATGTVTRCFWDKETSGQATSAGGTGLSTAQMQDIQTYLNAGWDCVGEIENGTREVWQMPEGGGYPVLAILSGYAPPQLQGLGTAENPYLVSDARELGAVVYYSCHAHYRLAASLDLSGIRWDTAVIPSFGGVFDGHNLTVAHLTVDGGGHLGLFGRLESGAEVKNLGIVDVEIAGSGSYVGGLVAQNAGIVTRCYSDGSVSGEDNLGGLAGSNGGTLTDCHSSGTVSGRAVTIDHQGVGGIVGTNRGGILTACHNTAAVTGGYVVGGVVGENHQGMVARCCNSGLVTGSGQSVGGLVGLNYGEDAVTYCCNRGEVRGGWDVGGLVGDKWGGDVRHSYSTGAVSGTSSVGGLVGFNSVDHVIHCYSSGAVSGTRESSGGLIGWGGGVVTGCFWDTQTSGQATSVGGTGRSTAEMQAAKTFLDAGWDFVGETANGTDDIWWVLEGKDYPKLWWESGEEVQPGP